MKNSISAKEQPLHKIFSNDYAFVIPEYQRPYSWTSEHARSLIEDLMGHIEKHRTSGTEDEIPPYFLGCIVLIRENGKLEVDVVDGQQRLTTLTILLACLRDSFENVLFSRDMEDCFHERGSAIRGVEGRHRLTLRTRDNEFFHRFVGREGGILELIANQQKLLEPQQKMREAALAFMSEIDELDLDGKKHLAKFIQENCYLVVVETSSFNSAYRIFGIINNRGLDLTTADLLKAEIIGGMHDQDRGHYSRIWETLEEMIGRDGMTELFGHMRTIRSKITPQGTLFEEVKKYILNPLNKSERSGPTIPKPAAYGHFFDSELEPMAEAFNQIKNCQYRTSRSEWRGSEEAVVRSLHWLNQTGSDWVPAALSYWTRNKNEATLMAKFFGALERLNFSLMIRGQANSKVVVRMSNIVREIEGGGDLFAQNSPLMLSAQEQGLTYASLDGPLYDTLGARKLNILLQKLDSILSSDAAIYPWSEGSRKITIEHILPQNPDPQSEWVKWIPSQGDRDLWVHRLGNLALLNQGKNSAAGRANLDEKKAVYFQKNGASPFNLTGQLANASEWSIGQLEKRQAGLLDSIASHWELQPLPFSVTEVPSGGSTRKRRPKFTFQAAGIIAGAKISFTEKPDVMATIQDDGNVILDGDHRRMTLMNATRQVLNDYNKVIRPILYWQHQGKPLVDLYEVANE